MGLQLACATQANSIFVTSADKVLEVLSTHVIQLCQTNSIILSGLIRACCWYLWLHWGEGTSAIATAVA
jgi:hypothetical protein